MKAPNNGHFCPMSWMIKGDPLDTWQLTQNQLVEIKDEKRIIEKITDPFSLSYQYQNTVTK